MYIAKPIRKLYESLFLFGQSAYVREIFSSIYPLSNAFSVNILVCSGRVLAWKNSFFFYYVHDRYLITICLLHYEELKKIFLVNVRVSSVFILKHSNSRKNDYQSNEYNLGYSDNYVDFLIGLPIPRS